MLGLLMAFHVLGLILWVGGVLSGGRVLIEHARLGARAPASFAVLERSFLFKTAHAGMLVVLLTGAGMLRVNPAYYLREHWMHAKLAFVVLLAAATVVLTVSRRKLEADPASVDAKTLNLWRGLFMGAAAAALLLVFLKPF